MKKIKSIWQSKILQWRLLWFLYPIASSLFRECQSVVGGLPGIVYISFHSPIILVDVSLTEKCNNIGQIDIIFYHTSCISNSDLQLSNMATFVLSDFISWFNSALIVSLVSCSIFWNQFTILKVFSYFFS